MIRPTKQLLVLIIHRHHDEQLRPPRRVVQHLTQCVSLLLEQIRVASRSRIAHERKLALRPHRTHIEQLLWRRAVQDEVAVEESKNANEEGRARQ